MSVRTVRNFWVEGTIDGRQSKLTGGPKSATGGIDLSVYMRNNKEMERPIRIVGKADEEGNLTLIVYGPSEVIKIETER